MRDVCEKIMGCTDDAENRTLPILHSLDNVCLEEKPIRSAAHCEEHNTCRAIPEGSNTWGDFEGFDEVTPQSEQFYYADDVLQLNAVISNSDGGPCTETDDPDGRDAFNEGDEHSPDLEQIFRLNFPSPFVKETSEEVKSLDILLASTPDEENMSCLLKSCLRLDCEKEKAGNILTGYSNCDWKNSKGCRDLMSLLCNSAENSSVNGDESSEVLKGPDVEQSPIEDTLYPIPKKSLIQTKLEVAPGSKQGHIISYHLFLKKPSDVPMSFLTFSRKKSFFSAQTKCALIFK